MCVLRTGSGDTKDTNLSALCRAWVASIFICWPLGTNTKHTISCNVLEACRASWAREMCSCIHVVLGTGHLPAMSIQYSLSQRLVIHVFCYIHSRNEQLFSSKLVANQSSRLDSHTAMVHARLHSLWHVNPPIICGIHMVCASHLLVAISVRTSTHGIPEIVSKHPSEAVDYIPWWWVEDTSPSCQAAFLTYLPLHIGIYSRSPSLVAEDIEAKVGETALEIVFPDYVKLAQPDFGLIQMRSHGSSLGDVTTGFISSLLATRSWQHAFQNHSTRTLSQLSVLPRVCLMKCALLPRCTQQGPCRFSYSMMTDNPESKDTGRDFFHTAALYPTQFPFAFRNQQQSLA